MVRIKKILIQIFEMVLTLLNILVLIFDGNRFLQVGIL
jgi:hypothetical protein